MLNLNNISMKPKLIGLFLAIGILPVVVTTLIAYQVSKSNMEQIAFNQLQNARDSKKIQIDNLFADCQAELNVLCNTVSTMLLEATDKISTVQTFKKRQLEQYFNDRIQQVKLITANRNLVTAFLSLIPAYENGGIEGEEWKQQDQLFSPFLKSFLETYSDSDLYLLSPSGDVVWSVAKKAELGSNLLNGSLKGSGLAQVFVKGKEGIHFQDYRKYEPAAGFASFMAGPVLGDNQELLGVLAIHLSNDPIQNIAHQRESLRETGDTYFVGKLDEVIAFRSDVLTAGEKNAIFKIGYPMKTPYIEKAIAGTSGRELSMDTLGNPVIVAYDPIEIEDVSWACVTKINFEEILTTKTEEQKSDFFQGFIEKYNYKDLLLFNSTGFAFYSVAHNPDYHTNFLKDAYSNTNLGEAVKNIFQNKTATFADFRPYEPCKGEPVAFVAQPVLSKNEIQFVVAMQISTEMINLITQERSGMGKTGETYLVGSDNLMRSDSFLDLENHSVKASFANPDKGKVDTESTRQALLGNSEVKITSAYNGNSVFSAYAPVDVMGQKWALLAEINQEEIIAPLSVWNTYSNQLGLLGWSLLVLVIAVILIVVISIILANNLSRPLIQGSEVAEVMADGDFTRAIHFERKDELGNLSNALNQMRERLSDVLLSIRQVSEQVAASSEELSASSQNLANGATEQAANLEETSSAMEELTSSIEMNTQNAVKTNTVTTQAAQKAKDGGDAVMETVAAMKRIAEQIRIIDDIADQTNLLALNAAIEAARAGEMGKGFAVVAVEVRKLAERSQQAAKEISDLSAKSVIRAENAGKLIQDVVPAIQEAASLVQEISAACEEQSKGADQIRTAINQLDQVTQQNSATSEQTASASEELSSQAMSLQEMIHQFKMNESTHLASKPGKESRKRTPSKSRSPQVSAISHKPSTRTLIAHQPSLHDEEEEEFKEI